MILLKSSRETSTTPSCTMTGKASHCLTPLSWTSRNPLGRTGEHGELADLASFMISDRAGYINGEMVVIDGGAHLRSSGAEDLLRWTDAQWAEQRAARSRA